MQIASGAQSSLPDVQALATTQVVPSKPYPARHVQVYVGGGPCVQEIPNIPHGLDAHSSTSRHVVPSNAYPASHVQAYEPTRFSQMPAPQGLAAHSSRSTHD